MLHPEDALAQAERHVRESEARVARQVGIVEELERDDHASAAALVRTVLATLRRNLELAREHLRLERGARGPAPP